MSVLLLSHKDDALAKSLAELTSRGAQNTLSFASLAELSGTNESDLLARFGNWADLEESVLGYFEFLFHEYAQAKIQQDPDFESYFSAILDWCLLEPYRTRYILEQSPLIPRAGQKEALEAFKNKIISLWAGVEEKNNILSHYVSLDGWMVFLRGVFMDSTYFISGMFPDTPVFRKEMAKLLKEGLEGYLV